MNGTRIPYMTMTEVPPSLPTHGDCWWSTISGQLFVYYDDGSTKQWVIANREGPFEPPTTGGTGGIITPERFGAKGDGVAGTDSVPATGTNDTQAFRDAIAYLRSVGGGVLACGPKRYMIDLTVAGGALEYDLSNITMQGVQGKTVFDFSRTEGYFNGAPGMDLIVRPNGFIRSIGKKHGGDSFAILSGTYSTTSGAVVLTLIAPHPLAAGASVELIGLTGTGTNLGSLNTTYVTTNITTGTTVTVNGGIGKGTITINGGTVKALDSGYMLTADTIEPVGAVAGILSGTRSGTTITQITDAPHGLVPGQLIWVLGDPDITGDDIDEVATTTSQDCFYTVGGRSVGRSIPVAVATVPTTASYTYEYAGDLTGQDTVMDTAALSYVFHASDVIRVADSSRFSRGERVLVGSLRERGRDNEHCNIGEYAIIGRILNSTMIRLQSDVRESYAIADGARVFKLAECENIVFDGITFVGHGHNPNTYNSNNVIQRGDSCLVLNHVHNLQVRNCKFIDLDLQSINIAYCHVAHIYNNTIVQDQRDQAGATYGVIDIQYGINYGAAGEDIILEQNSIYGGRHAIVQGGSTAQTDFGVARNVRILANYCAGQWLEAISTHQGSDTVLYSHNYITGARGGINPRYSKNTMISNNIIICKFNGVVLYNDLINVKVSDNIIDAGAYPIWMKSIDNPTAPTQTTGLTSSSGKLSSATPAGPSIEISGNQIRNGLNGIYCVDITPGLEITGLEITNNSFYRSRNGAILISAGYPTVNSFAVASGTYNNTTGVVWLTMADPIDAHLIANVMFDLSALTGVAGFASLAGRQYAITPTGEYVTFQDTPGNGATTINGGTIVLPGPVNVAITSGTYDTTTGIATLRLPFGTTGHFPGMGFTLSGLTGTGNFAALNGAQTAIAPTGHIVTFVDTPGLGATTSITSGTLVLPAGGWTGTVSNNRFYDCCLTSSTYQVRLSNAKNVKFNDNLFAGTSTYPYAFLLEGVSTTGCELLRNTVPPTLYTRDAFTPHDVVDENAVVYPGVAGSGHKADFLVREDVVISGGVAAMKFLTTRHLRLRMEDGTADDLVSITGASLDQELALSTQGTGWVITVKHGAGFELDGNVDKVLNNRMDKMKVIWSDQDAKFVQVTPLMDHA